MGDQPSIQDVVAAILAEMGVGAAPLRTIIIQKGHFVGHKYRFDGGDVISLTGRNVIEAYGAETMGSRPKPPILPWPSARPCLALSADWAKDFPDANASHNRFACRSVIIASPLPRRIAIVYPTRLQPGILIVVRPEK